MWLAVFAVIGKNECILQYGFADKPFMMGQWGCERFFMDACLAAQDCYKTLPDYF